MGIEILVKEGSAAQTITFGDAGDDYAITLTGLASAAARQSAKADFGATRADLYDVIVEIDSGTAPAAGKTVDFYWSASTSSTAATSNAAGASGSDAAYKASEELEWLKQSEFIGSLIATADTNTTQIQSVGRFSPGTRYGQLIVMNNLGQALRAVATMVITFHPIVTEAQ